MVDGITVPQPCSEGWINEVVHALKRVDIRVDPRQLGGGDLFDDKADKVLAETPAEVGGEILDPREHLRPADDPRENESWEDQFFPKLNKGDQSIDEGDIILACNIR